MPSLDQFKAPTKEETEKRDRDLRALEAQTKRVAQLGAECLSDTKFKKYLAEVSALRDRYISAMKEFANPDPVKDAFFLRTCLSKIDVFDMLLDLVKKDIRKGKK